MLSKIQENLLNRYHDIINKQSIKKLEEEAKSHPKVLELTLDDKSHHGQILTIAIIEMTILLGIVISVIAIVLK